jgi:elongation factor 1-alpha
VHLPLPLLQAMAGDNVAFNLKGVSQHELRRGMVVSDAANRPALPARSFTARIVVLSHPTSIRVGYCPVVDVHTAHVACKLTRLVSRTPKGTRDTINDPSELLPGDRAMVELEPLHPLCVEPYSEYPQLGCFAIRDLSTTIAVGQVTEVVHDEMEQVVVQEDVQSNGYLH